MKTCLTYGIALALVNFLFTLVLFIFGLHSDPAKLGLAQGLGTLGGLIIGVTITALGMKAARAKSPPEAAFTYGNAFGVGTGIAAVASFLSIFTHTLYIRVINPQFTELIVQAKLAKLESSNLTSDQVDRAEKLIRTMTSPTWQAVSICIASFILGLIIALIVAAFLRRDAPPPTLENSPA